MSQSRHHPEPLRKGPVSVATIIGLTIIVTTVATIAISEENKKRLLEIAADLQKTLRKRVDFDEVIMYLTERYRAKTIDKEAFNRFCAPIRGTNFRELYSELLSERRREEA